MSTATTDPTTAAPSPLEFSGPIALVPTLADLERLTAVPERRVVYRGVDWSFYEQLVDSIPESSPIRVAYDGKDLEVMAKGRVHDKSKRRLGRIVDIVAEEYGIPFDGNGETTWKRPGVGRGLEADESFYFQPEKLAAAAESASRRSNDIADYPNPDLAIEVDISRPQVDRPGIYAALKVTEVWTFDGEQVVIERLTAEGKYAVVEKSGFLPVRAEDVRRWLVDGYSLGESTWAQRLRAEIRGKRQGEHQEIG
jgi:Uma2 family endonuclease